VRKQTWPLKNPRPVTPFVLFVPSDIDKDARIVLTETKLEFQGKSHGKVQHSSLPCTCCTQISTNTLVLQEYSCDLEFFAEVDPQDSASKFDIKARSVLFHVIKKDKAGAFWPRLLKVRASYELLQLSRLLICVLVRSLACAGQAQGKEPDSN
jgi:hypothetical protein